MLISSLKSSSLPGLKFKYQVLALAAVFLAAVLSKLPLLFPAAKGHLGPIGSHEFFCPLVLYSAPFLFLAYCLGTSSNQLRFGPFDQLYAAIVLMNTISYFWANRSFLPVNPILTEISTFFLYLLIRNLYSRLRGLNTLFVLALPAIPSAVEAGHGLLQAIQKGLPVEGAFLNYNFFGMLLAMNIPLAASQVFPRKNGTSGRVLALLSAIFFCIAVVMTTSRTAACGTAVTLGIALALYFQPSLRSIWQSWKALAKTVVVVFLTALISITSYLAYSIRPLSIHGRLSLYKVALHTFSDNLLAGIGYGMIFPLLAKYQEQYFALGSGNEIDRILAGSTGMINSTYLSRAVETGIIGLCLYLPFWFLILKTAFTLLRPDHEPPESSSGDNPPLGMLLRRMVRGEDNDMIRFATGSVLILFLIMSFSYAPLENMQISIYFGYILGIAVSLAEDRRRMKTGEIRADQRIG